MKATSNGDGVWTLAIGDMAPTYRGLTLMLDDSQARELWASLNEHFGPKVTAPIQPFTGYPPYWHPDSPLKVTCDSTQLPPGVEVVTG